MAVSGPLPDARCAAGLVLNVLFPDLLIFAVRVCLERKRTFEAVRQDGNFRSNPVILEKNQNGNFSARQIFRKMRA